MPSKKRSRSLSKAERREQNRARAAKIKAEQERREKRNRMLMMIAGAVLLVLVIAAVWTIISDSKKSALSDLKENSSDAVPAQFTDDGALPFGKELIAGKTDEAKHSIDIYYDLMCSHCALLDAQYTDELRGLAQSGAATVNFFPVSIMNQPFSNQGIEALAAVVDNAPDKAWEFQHELQQMGIDIFVNKTRTAAPTMEDLTQLITKVGAPAEAVTAFEQGTYKELPAALTKIFLGKGHTGTPTVKVDGKEINVGKDLGEQGFSGLLGEDVVKMMSDAGYQLGPVEVEIAPNPTAPESEGSTSGDNGSTSEEQTTTDK